MKKFKNKLKTGFKYKETKTKKIYILPFILYPENYKY